MRIMNTNKKNIKQSILSSNNAYHENNLKKHLKFIPIDESMAEFTLKIEDKINRFLLKIKKLITNPPYLGRFRSLAHIAW